MAGFTVTETRIGEMTMQMRKRSRTFDKLSSTVLIPGKVDSIIIYIRIPDSFQRCVRQARRRYTYHVRIKLEAIIE